MHFYPTQNTLYNIYIKIINPLNIVVECATITLAYSMAKNQRKEFST